MSCPAYPSIRDPLARFPSSPPGFVVFRCTYASDTRWDKFMLYLTTSVLKRLEREELGDVAHSLDWAVQHDATSLDGAGFETVRG